LRQRKFLVGVSLLAVPALVVTGALAVYGLDSSSGPTRLTTSVEPPIARNIEPDRVPSVGTLDQAGGSREEQPAGPLDVSAQPPGVQGGERDSQPLDHPAQDVAGADREDPGASESADVSIPELQASSREVEVDFRQFSQLLPKDAIFPIYQPRFVVGESANLHPDDLVIGVAINGESKAYPVGPLNFREMVNDTVGGVPVLVTW